MRTISGNYTTGITLTSSNNPVTVTGNINASVPSGSALYGPGGTNWTITNSGQIHNSNASSGTAIEIGSFSGDYAAVAAITNLSGGNISGAGSGIIILSNAGSLTNNANGVIEAGYFTGVGMYGGKATVVNDGVILTRHTSKNVYGSYTQGNGVVLYDGGLVVNAAGATISGTRGGVFASGYYKTVGVSNPGYATYGVTVDNAGTIIGNGQGGAVDFFSYSTANRLIDHPGAVFIGGYYRDSSLPGISRDVSGNGGTLELASGSSTGVLSGFGTNFAGFKALQFDTNAKWTVSGAYSDFAGVNITGFNSSDTLTLAGFTEADYSFSGNTLTLTNSSNGTVSLQVQDNPGSHFTVTNSGGNTVIDGPVTCFLAGTHVLTDRGEVPVEAIAADDIVITANGQPRRVRWVGHRRLDLRRHRVPELAQPILIRANAFADNVPHRDLRVSPDHALLHANALIPARLLINGASILRETHHHTVTYYHIELETHDILLAEALPAESYLDTGNRGMFENAGEPLILHPDFADAQRQRVATSCRPFVDAPEDVRPVWHQLATRAEMLGLRLPAPIQATNDPDLLVLAGGRTIHPLRTGADGYTFLLPPSRDPIRLVSRTTRPCDQQPWVEDRRRLGVMVARLTLRVGDEVKTIPLDHPALSQGWWDLEHDDATSWRWTDGDAVLPIHATGPVVLQVECVDALDYPLTMACQAA
jgi:Hint domain